MTKFYIVRNLNQRLIIESFIPTVKEPFKKQDAFIPGIVFLNGESRMVHIPSNFIFETYDKAYQHVLKNSNQPSRGIAFFSSTDIQQHEKQMFHRLTDRQKCCVM